MNKTIGKIIPFIDNIFSEIILAMIFLYGIFKIENDNMFIYGIPVYFVLLMMFAYLSFRISFMQIRKQLYNMIMKIKDNIDKEINDE